MKFMRRTKRFCTLDSGHSQQIQRSRSLPAFAKAASWQAGKRLQLGFDWQFDVDRALLFSQSAAKLRQCDILQLPNALPCNAEFLADFLERLRFAAIQSEPLENNFLLAIIQHVEQPADFIAQIFVPQQFEWRLSILITNN